MEFQDKLHFSSSYRSELIARPNLIKPRPVKIVYAEGTMELAAMIRLPRPLLSGLYEIERSRSFSLTMADGKTMLASASIGDVRAIEPVDSLELSRDQQRQCLQSRKFLAADSFRESLDTALQREEISCACPECAVVLREGVTPDCPDLWPYVPKIAADVYDSMTGLALVTPKLGELIALVSSPFCQSVQVNTPYVLFGGHDPS